MITQPVIEALMADKEVLNYRSRYQEEILERRKALKNHFDEDYPAEFLFTTRPGEAPWMKKARAEVWECPTLEAIARVTNLLAKIRQADDFRITWNENEVETGIAKENSFKTYLTEKLPVVKNLEDWLFQTYQNFYLKDPNSLEFVGPEFDELKYEGTTNNPYPQIIESDRILVVRDDYFFFELSDPWEDKIRRIVGIDTTSAYFIDWDTEKEKEDERIEFTLIDRKRVFQELPIKSVGSIMAEQLEKNVVFDSILAGALPNWNQALRRADDDNINWIKYAYPKEWEISSGTCKTCAGKGSVPGKNGGNLETCKTCKGCGEQTVDTPFERITLNVAKANALNPNVTIPPIPPAGIVERDLDAIKAFGTEIDRLLDKGFRALGLESLYQVPLSTSGESKKQDKTEGVYPFLYQIGVVYVTTYKWTAKQIYLQKYGSLPASEEQRKAALPDLPYPADFDILSAEELSNALAQAKDKGFGPEIINGLERDLIEKQYGENSEAAMRHKISVMLDPLPNLKPDEKALYKEAGLVSELDAMISVKLVSYINRLTAEDKNWWLKKFEDKRADVEKLAQADVEKIKANNPVQVTAFA